MRCAYKKFTMEQGTDMMIGMITGKLEDFALEYAKKFIDPVNIAKHLAILGLGFFTGGSTLIAEVTEGIDTIYSIYDKLDKFVG